MFRLVIVGAAGFLLVARVARAVDCDDGNPCTVDLCDPERHEPFVNGTSRSDGNLCNGAETYQGGVCTPGPPVLVNDFNPCTRDTCDEQTGGRNDPVPNGTPCPDGRLCNGVETCQDGVCTAGRAIDCDDGDPCTLDTCSPADGCHHALAPACPVTTTTTRSEPTTTTTTVPAPPSCPPDGCDDADPCTADGCRDGRCVHEGLVGLPSAACVCERPEAPACRGERLPQGVLDTHLVVGTGGARYCLRFAAPVRDEPGQFVAKAQPAPPSCP
jgi:hypothetical protein